MDGIESSTRKSTGVPTLDAHVGHLQSFPHRRATEICHRHTQELNTLDTAVRLLLIWGMHYTSLIIIARGEKLRKELPSGSQIGHTDVEFDINICGKALDGAGAERRSQSGRRFAPGGPNFDQQRK
jgi:hypothetical protein